MPKHEESQEDTKMEEEEEKVEFVQCRFKTNIKNEDYHVEEDIIDISSQTTRKMLTKMIHSLLDNDIPKKTKFEFLINGRMLRGTIAEMMKLMNLSNDEIVEITYTFAMHKPKEDEKIENDEWIKVIKSIFVFEERKKPGAFAAGFFDGTVKLYDEEGEVVYNKQLHEDVVNDIIFQKESKDNWSLITAGEDAEIGFHKLSREDGEIKDRRIATILQQANALSFCPTNSEMITLAGNDTLLKIYDSSADVLAKYQEKETTSHKRTKTTVAYLKPVAKIGGNSHPVNCLKWINNSEIVTGGYDHALRIFNVDREELASSIFTNNKAITCIDSVKDNVLVGCEDHAVRLWDIRSNSTDPVKVFKGHNGWVSSVQMNPSSDYHFISSAYDSRTLVWDFRCDEPLYKIGLSPAEKIFASSWNSSSSIISGGDTGMLQVHKVKSTD
ncbi:unnamed protein product [Moneuplotes crassus]|uniref:NLE domain-containing protein n=1 Tax=Euplotes crassus TaxID=5936 RepID=A0AAD1UPF5_EUPCR|nr:unnamed protein product [Moneuplotes crassus]